MFGLWRRVPRGDKLSDEGLLPELRRQTFSCLRGFPGRRGARAGRPCDVDVFFAKNDPAVLHPPSRASGQALPGGVRDGAGDDGRCCDRL